MPPVPLKMEQSRKTAHLIRALTLLLACAFVTTETRGQTTRTIPNTISCRDCRIETISNVILRGEPAGEEIIQPPLNVVAGNDNTLYVLRDGAALNYRLSGQYLRSFARHGSGPGEISSPADLWITPGDSLLLFDHGNQRAVLYSRQGHAVRHIGFPYRFRNGIVLRWPDSVIMSGPANTPAGAARPLHLLSFRGNTATVIHPFGAGDGRLQRGRELSLQHLVTQSSTGGWMSISPSLYEIIAWSDDLRPRTRFSRRPEWLLSESDLGTGTPTTPPSPRIRHIIEDRNGMTWVFSWLPSPDWRQAWTGVSVGSGQEISTSRIRVDKFYTTQVDVLDLGRGALVASSTLQGAIVGLIGTDRVALYQYSVAGEPILRILQLRLARNNGRSTDASSVSASLEPLRENADRRE